MAASINASTTAGVVTTADTSGVLNIQTANTTAISISASQVVSYTNNPTYSGGTANGVLYLNGSKVATSGSALVFDGTNLGVGTSSPARNLEVQGSVGYLAAFRNNSSTATTTYINVINANNVNAGLVMAHINDGTGYFGTQNNAALRLVTNDSERMRLDPSGNLLVGTTSSTVWNGAAGTKFVVGGSGNTIASLQTSTTTVDQGAIFEGYATGISSNSAALGSIAFLRSNTSTTALSSYTAFYTNSAGTVAERARIDSSGNLLVGTTSGTENRIFKSSSTYSTRIENTSTSTGSTLLLQSGRAAGTGFTNIECYSNGSLNFQVLGNGNVQNTNNSYGALSDIKLKENVVDATPKLEKLCQVRVVNYNFKEGQTHKQIGVIAQELEQIFPGMVEESPDRDADGNDLGTTTKQVKYSVFVPMLIKAIQEQQNLINTLNARIDAIEGAKQ